MPKKKKPTQTRYSPLVKKALADLDKFQKARKRLDVDLDKIQSAGKNLDVDLKKIKKTIISMPHCPAYGGNPSSTSPGCRYRKGEPECP